MAKKVAPKFRPSTPNTDKGYATHGSFKMDSRTKPGKKSLNKHETLRNRDAGVHARIKKIGAAMFRKRMMVSEHSQFNG